MGVGRSFKEEWKEVLLSEHRQEHVSIGNLNIDITVEIREYPKPDTTIFAERAWIGPGGAATNYAVAIARMGQAVKLVARTGEDALRLGIIDELERAGVDTSYVQVAKGESPGTVVVLVNPSDSSRAMVSVRGANAGLSGTLVPPGGDVYHFASTSPRVIREASQALGGVVSYDPGSEVFRGIEGLEDLSGVVRILYLSLKEAERIPHPNTKNLLELGFELVVIKLGEEGAIAYSRDGVYRARPVRLEGLVDVTGAGDVFDAAFNLCWAAGCGIESSLEFAVLVGAIKTTRRGSSNAPSRQDILEFIERI